MILLCVFQAGQLRNVWCEYSLHSEQEMKLSVSVNSSKLSKKKERPLAIENFHVSYTRFTRDVRCLYVSFSVHIWSWSRDDGRLTSYEGRAVYFYMTDIDGCSRVISEQGKDQQIQTACVKL